MEGGRDGGMEMVKEGLERCVCWGTGILLGDCVCVCVGGQDPTGKLQTRSSDTAWHLPSVDQTRLSRAILRTLRCQPVLCAFAHTNTHVEGSHS